jgi:glycerol kinase
VCGAAIQWLRDNLQMIKKSSISENFASKVPDSDGVVVVPAFTGLGAPYWEPDARGAILGIKRSTKKEHIVRATLESIAFQSDDLIKAMEKDLGRKITDLKVDGGASLNNFLMQNQADISDIHIVRHKSIESTSLGAAYLAGLASGYYKSIEDIIEIKDIDKEFYPAIEGEERQRAKAKWHRAVEAVLALAEDEVF